MAEEQLKFEKGMSHTDFKEAALNDATFSSKLALLEGPAAPGNMKDRSLMVKDYMQDTDDQLTKDTEEENTLEASFEENWNGTANKYGVRSGGLSDTTKRIFSWMNDYRVRKDAITKKKEARLTQALALQEQQMNSQFDELARVYGNPRAAIASILKLVDDQHALIVKLTANDVEIQGQMKLGHEKK